MFTEILNAAAVIPVPGLLICACLNGSGHTGLPVLALVPVYLIHFGYNVFGLLLKRRTVVFRQGITIDCFGLVLPLALHFFSILMQYDSWAKAGMPEPPSWRIPFLAAYGFLFAAAVIISARYRRRGTEENA